MHEQDPVEKRRLLHRMDELVRRRELLSERVALFPNAVNRRQLDELEVEIAVAKQRLNEVEAVRS